MSTVTENDISNLHACNEYLSYMLHCRVSELKAARHEVAQLARQHMTSDATHCHINTDEAIFNLPLESSCRTSSTPTAGECSSEQSAEKASAEELYVMQPKIVELEEACSNLVSLNSDLEARLHQEESLRKEKEDAIEKLEEVLMLLQIELAEISEPRNAKLEIEKQLQESKQPTVQQDEPAKIPNPDLYNWIKP